MSLDVVDIALAKYTDEELNHAADRITRAAKRSHKGITSNEARRMNSAHQRMDRVLVEATIALLVDAGELKAFPTPPGKAGRPTVRYKYVG